MTAGEVLRQDITLGTNPLGPGDMDGDGDIDLTDLSSFVFCLQGPELTFLPGHFCLNGDADGDMDVDLADFASFQTAFTGPG